MDQWLGLEIRHLAALEAISAERSFRGAADRLGYVQSAVSQQLSALEALVGTRLVERSRGHSGVALTEAGLLLLDHAKRILERLDAARADFESLADGTGRTLRVGASQSVMTGLLPRVLRRLAARHPGLRVAAVEAASDGELFDAVAGGDLECAIAELPLNPGPFSAIELLVDPCALLVNADSPLAALDRVPTLGEIADLPLTAPSWRMTDVIEHQFRIAGLQPRVSFPVESNAAAQALVSAGLAAAIMPRLAVEPVAPGTVALDLDELLPPRTLVLYWNADRVAHPHLHAFADSCRAVCRELKRSWAHARAQAAITRIDPHGPQADEAPVVDKLASELPHDIAVQAA